MLASSLGITLALGQYHHMGTVFYEPYARHLLNRFAQFQNLWAAKGDTAHAGGRRTDDCLENPLHPTKAFSPGWKRTSSPGFPSTDLNCLKS